MTAPAPAPVRACPVVTLTDAGGQHPRQVVSHYFRRIGGVWTCIHCGTEADR